MAKHTKQVNTARRAVRAHGAGMLDARGAVTNQRKGGDTLLMVLVSLLVITMAGGGFFFWSATNSSGVVQAPVSHETDMVVAEERVLTEPADPMLVASPEAHDVQISLAMVGDVLMHDETIASGALPDGGYNYTHLFANVAYDISRVDLALVNQETILGGPEVGGGVKGYPLFNSPQEVGDAEVDAGFDVILKATNHTFDQGYAGLHSELAYWNLFHPSIAVVGATDPYDEFWGFSNEVYIFEKEGFRVAVLNYTWATNTGVGSDDAYVLSYMDDGKVADDVARARELGADIVVVCPHWGVEYGAAPSQEEHDYANFFLELGVDLVIGCHPHVLQPVEVLTREDGHRMLVYYSLGNFVSSQVSVDRVVGGMARVWMTKSADGVAKIDSYELVPLVTYVASGTDYTTFPLRAFNDELAAGINNRGGLTFGSALQLCVDVLGEGFNAEKCELEATMDAPAAPPANLMSNPTPPAPPATPMETKKD